MSDKPGDRRFANSEALLNFLREHVDDIESLVIPVQEAIQVTGPRSNEVWEGAGAVIRLCSGHRMVIGREDAAMLINDGVLQRMKIKCVLDPLRRP